MRASRRPSRLVAATVVALAAGLPPSSSLAQSPPRRGESCFEAAEAAQPLLKDHKLRAAQQKLIVCARDACPNPARSDCRAWLDDVNRVLPTVVFRGRETRAGGDVAVDDVRVSVDGEVVVPGRLDETPVAIDPGVRLVRFEHAGFPAVEQRIELHEGETRRVVEVIFRQSDTTPSSTIPGPAPGPAPPHPHPPADETDGSPVPTATWAMLGAGAVTLALGISFEAVGLSSRSQLIGSCKGNKSCPPSDVDSARDTVIAGDVALALSAAFVAGAAYFYFTRPDPDARRATDGIRLLLGPIGRGVVAGVEGSL